MTGNIEHVETVIIGGGHAGLTVHINLIVAETAE